jgi:hypothetical protein
MMNFDFALVKMPDGVEQKLTVTEFMAVPLGDRIQLMTGSKIKFYRDGAQISPLDAVRRVAPPR